MVESDSAAAPSKEGDQDRSPPRDVADLGLAAEEEEDDDDDDDDVDEGVDTAPSKPSPSSSLSPSPSASPPPAVASNGRISVSLPSQMEQERSPDSPMREPAPLQVLALAVPSQNPFPGGPNFAGGGGSGGVGSREDIWTESATEVLIDAWAERYVGLSKGSLKQNNWKEVADIVNSAEDRPKAPRSEMQCKNRIDTVKKRYRAEKARVVAGSGPSGWKFFEKMDRLLGHSYQNPMEPAARTKSGNGLDKAWTAAKAPRSKSKSKKRGWASGWESDGDDNDDDEVDDDEADDENLLPPFRQSLHGQVLGRKAKATDRGHGGLIGGDALLELTKAIESFGEVYEKTERAKLREVVEMEKQRMKFAKEMEVQRMEFFMKTQVEIVKHGNKKARRADRSGNSNATEDHL